MNLALGVFFHWLGGLASASFYIPYRGVKRWSWETYWIVGGGLVCQGDALRGFAIAGENGRFVWAEAKIVGDEILVFSPEIAEPRSARYGWADNPEVNLYSKEGLPASPFRTDFPKQ